MIDNCIACGAALTPTRPGSERHPCPNCGSTARILNASARVVAGFATCSAKGVVVRPSPAILELRALNPAVDSGDSSQVEQRSRVERLIESRVTGLRVLLEDFARAGGDGHLQPALAARIVKLIVRVLSEMARGDFIGRL